MRDRDPAIENLTSHLPPDVKAMSSLSYETEIYDIIVIDLMTEAFDAVGEEVFGGFRPLAKVPGRDMFVAVGNLVDHTVRPALERTPRRRPA